MWARACISNSYQPYVPPLKTHPLFSKPVNPTFFVNMIAMVS